MVIKHVVIELAVVTELVEVLVSLWSLSLSNHRNVEMSKCRNKQSGSLIASRFTPVMK